MEDYRAEFAAADLLDAYMHFGVLWAELKHCLAPGADDVELLLFWSMLFGFKSAPLIMSRLSALLQMSYLVL